MIVQSSQKGIRLLPALPGCWPAGSLQGMRVYGGIELDMAWSRGKVTALCLKSQADRDVVVAVGDAMQTFKLAAGVSTDCVIA